MKKLLFALFMIGFLLSCSDEGPLLSGQEQEKSGLGMYPQKWQLTKMTGSIPNAETTGNDMAWKEYYLLYSDNTFVKSRERNGVVMEATGSYAFIVLLEEPYLELAYDTYSELIGSCTVEPREHLRLISEEKLVGTWQACDGPGLVYEKTEF